MSPALKFDLTVIISLIVGAVAAYWLIANKPPSINSAAVELIRACTGRIDISHATNETNSLTIVTCYDEPLKTVAPL